MQSFPCEHISNKEIWKCLWVKNVVHVIYDVKQRQVVHVAQMPDGLCVWVNGTQKEKAPTYFSENTMGRILDSHNPFIDYAYFTFNCIFQLQFEFNIVLYWFHI